MIYVKLLDVDADVKLNSCPLKADEIDFRADIELAVGVFLDVVAREDEET